MENNDFQLSNGINNNNRKFFVAATFEGLWVDPFQTD